MTFKEMIYDVCKNIKWDDKEDVAGRMAVLAYCSMSYRDMALGVKKESTPEELKREIETIKGEVLRGAGV